MLVRQWVHGASTRRLRELGTLDARPVTQTPEASLGILTEHGPTRPFRRFHHAQRAWLLGPKRIGPNLLLAPPADAESSLFSVPASAVTRAAKVTSKTVGPGAAGAAAAVAAAEAGAAGATATDLADGAAAPAPVARLDLRLGSPLAACSLGLVPSSSGSETNGTGGGAAAGAADEAEQWPEAVRHMVSSVESGVVAGFQLATSSGGAAGGQQGARQGGCKVRTLGTGYKQAIRGQQGGGGQQEGWAQGGCRGWVGELVRLVSAAEKAADAVSGSGGVA